MNPTTQLVEAIWQHVADAKYQAATEGSYGEDDTEKAYTAILLAIADAVDTQIGEDAKGMCASHKQMAVSLDYVSPKWAKDVPCDHYAGQNAVNARMRTFTAALRERAGA